MSSAHEYKRETRFCGVCNENKRVISKSGYIISKFHRHIQRFALIVKNYVFDNPEII